MENNNFLNRIKITSEVLRKIAKIDELKGLWHGGLRLSPQILGRLKATVVISSTGASTRIEGVTMTDAEVARLLRGLKSTRPKNRDEQEVAGYADLLGRIFDNYKTFKLSESSILFFHKTLLEFSSKDQIHRGKYKDIDNVVMMKNEKGKPIILFRPTPPYLVKAEMDNVIDWTNKQLENRELHPLLVIANFVFEFLAIHPFIDGNGRLSRILTNLLLLRNGYTYIPYVSLEEIIESRRSEYYLALRASQKNHKTDNENLTPWINFLLDALLTQAEKAQELIGASQPEKLLSGNQEKIYHLFKEGELLGVAEIDRRLRGAVPQVTIKQTLSRLVALRLLERIGQGRGTRYREI